MHHWTFRLIPAVFLLVAGCGSTSLTSPEFLPRTVYAVGAKQMTFVMTTCSDTCSSYAEAECDVELDSETGQLIVDVSMEVTERPKPAKEYASDPVCGLTCGPSVYAHCELPSLAAGKYQVIAGSFETSIEIQ
jgi:hypothetical protein